MNEFWVDWTFSCQIIAVELTDGWGRTMSAKLAHFRWAITFTGTWWVTILLLATVARSVPNVIKKKGLSSVGDPGSSLIVKMVFLSRLITAFLKWSILTLNQISFSSSEYPSILYSLNTWSLLTEQFNRNRTGISSLGFMKWTWVDVKRMITSSSACFDKEVTIPDEKFIHEHSTLLEAIGTYWQAFVPHQTWKQL